MSNTQQNDPEFLIWAAEHDQKDLEAFDEMDEDGYLAEMADEYEDGAFERQGSGRY